MYCWVVDAAVIQFRAFYGFDSTRQCSDLIISTSNLLAKGFCAFGESFSGHLQLRGDVGRRGSLLEAVDFLLQAVDFITEVPATESGVLLLEVIYFAA